jgi:hypothetical protein
MQFNDDVPPKHSINEWSDREFLDRMYQVRVNSPCTLIAQQSYALMQIGRLSSQDKSVADGFYTLCMTPYMDKNFYSCVKKSMSSVNGEPVEKLSQEFLALLDGRPMSNAANNTLNECVRQHGNVVQQLTQRMTVERDTKKVNQLYKEFTNMTDKSNTIINDNEAESVVTEKFTRVRDGVCSSYVTPDISTIPREKMIHFGEVYTNYGLCLISNLCADRIKKCLQRGESYRECVIYQPDEAIQECTARVDRVWNGPL